MITETNPDQYNSAQYALNKIYTSTQLDYKKVDKIQVSKLAELLDFYEDVIDVYGW